MKRHDSRNAYEVELLADLNSSLVFNILDLTEYYEGVIAMRLQIYSGVF